MKLLNERVPDHPVLLVCLHSFAVWGNKLAFERAGVTRDTKPPVGGNIVKDQKGAPTGISAQSRDDAAYLGSSGADR